jgi:hypothetical protein
LRENGADECQTGDNSRPEENNLKEKEAEKVLD